MKKEGIYEKVVFSSYEDLKKHRNDNDLAIYGPNGYLMLYTAKELRAEDYQVPTGWDKSDYSLYYEDYNRTDYFEHKAIETIDLDDIWALREIKA